MRPMTDKIDTQRATAILKSLPLVGGVSRRDEGVSIQQQTSPSEVAPILPLLRGEGKDFFSPRTENNARVDSSRLSSQRWEGVHPAPHVFRAGTPDLYAFGSATSSQRGTVELE